MKLTSVKVWALYSFGKQFETRQKQFGKVLEVWVNSASTRRKENFFGHKIDMCEGLGTV
jgi:hypothetical protein